MTDTPTEERDEETDTVGFSDLETVQEGDRIAVRAVNTVAVKVLVGTVVTKMFEDPEAEDPRLEPAVDDSESSYSTTYLSIEYSTLWEIVDGEPVDVTDVIDSRPSYRPYAAEPPQEPPSPGLQYSSDDRFELIIPEPTSNGQYVNGYYPSPFGTVTDVTFGETIWPEELLPTTPSSP